MGGNYGWMLRAWAYDGVRIQWVRGKEMGVKGPRERHKREKDGGKNAR